jgi:hypothetical protein
MSDAYRGEAKTDACSIAETARQRRDFATIDVLAQLERWPCAADGPPL